MVKVSVIVPCYNYGKFLPDAIDSVLAQTFSDFEVIIVDDASDDDETTDVVKAQAQKDKRIKMIFHDHNKGVASARNTGIRQAQAKYILPLDADDIVPPAFLQEMIAVLEKKNADVVYTHMQFFGEKDNIAYTPSPKEIKNIIAFNCFIPSCSLYKKSDWKAFGGYDETMKLHEDLDFWHYFIEANKKFVLLDDVLLYYRRHAGSLSYNARLNSETRGKIKKKHPSLYRWHNYYFTFNYFRYIVRPKLFQLRTRKGKRVFRLLGVTFYED